ncbi:MAG TPA: alpha/beta hydrolase, partial [Caldilineaceae bacterium]|nr:alpha/beta hydrolase [Caldilineaceae bacterium]
MPYLATARLTMHYRTQGQSDGLGLLLVHGSYATGRWWEPLLATLPDEVYALVPDLRGCGQSDKPATGYTIEEQAADLAAMLDLLGQRALDVVAQSSGGAIAMELALTRPDLLRSLVLVDSVPVEGVYTPIEALMALEQMRKDSDLLRQALRLLMPTFELSTDENQRFFEQLVADALQMAPPAFTAVAESLGRWNRFAEAKRLTLPTLLVWGELDEIVPRAATTRTLIAIPGARNLEVLHGVGHSPPTEAPLTLAEKIIEFISEDFDETDQVRAGVATPPP